MNVCVWVASQYYPKKDFIRLAVVDNGCGFLESFKIHVKFQHQHHLEAILWILQSRVSCNRSLMDSSVLPQTYAHDRIVGSRLSATPIREQIAIALAQKAEVVLDFSSIEATQSCIDGLVGILVLQRGPDVLERLVFKSCSDDVKAILQFVVADRCDQYLKAHSH
ncbi:MAG: STAS-like domain-containing protein [Sulfuriferula sp.]